MRYGLGLRITQLRNSISSLSDLIRLYVTQNGQLYETSDQLNYRVRG